MSTKNVEVPGVKGGEDTFGIKYASTNEMWKAELGRADPTSADGWYGKGVKYWDGVDATVDGVLGGYGKVTDVDIKESCAFLLALQDRNLLSLSEPTRAVDCGAGIGRISEGMLCKMFTCVDLVEPVKHFLDRARELLGSKNAKNFYQVGLQDWTPEAESYDVIWVQWVIGHLTDDDFIAFFTRCRRGLKKGGIIVLKENVCKDGFLVDKEDSSVTRSDAYLTNLFKTGGFDIVHKEYQKEFPQELFQVCMFAVR